MDELKKDKKQLEEEISRAINNLEKKYEVTVSDINVFRSCYYELNGKPIKAKFQVELKIEI